MTATIKRGTPARRAVATRKVAKQSTIDRLLARSPVGHDALRRAATGAILLVAAGVLVAGATWAGVPGIVGRTLSDQAGRAGLRVEQVEVTGLKHMDFMTVNAVALDQRSLAMPSVDLEGVRQRLLAYGWIKDAHVSRRLPDTLMIQIDEREPAAVWQDQGHLMLIDAGGVILDQVDAGHMPNLPLVIGPGAHLQEAAYQALLTAAPALKRHVRAATWVGNRRWDLLFDSGETLLLPEGEHESAAALAKFAGLQAARPLLRRGWLRFDLRDPAKLVARRPGAAERALADPGEAKADENKGDRG